MTPKHAREQRLRVAVVFFWILVASAWAGLEASAAQPSDAAKSPLGGTLKVPDERPVDGTSAGWSNDGQFWVVDLEPIALRMFGADPSARSGLARAGSGGASGRESSSPPAEGAKEAKKAPASKQEGEAAPASPGGRARGEPGSERVYWYFLYNLRNPSSEDREIFVNVTAVSDGIRQYSDVYVPEVERAIERKEKGPLWGKTDEFELLSKRDPKDPKYHYVTLPAKSTRQCVAIFRPIDPNASKITIRVTGLSNEIRRSKKDDGTEELEHRVLELQYTRPGDEYGIALDTFKFVGKEWTKRKVPLVRPGAASGG